ncbi:MAG: hypothetical protein NWQ09_02510 [Nonlabens sp.]|nr:hypothetical protein [Nonlabens sp.]
MHSKFSHIIILFSLIMNTSCKNEVVCQVDEQSRGSLIYNIDEASCFIALRLKETAPELALIREALFQEEKYMIKIGIITEDTTIDNEETDIVLDFDKLIQFAQDNMDNSLSKEQLEIIYETENEYLQFIGSID